jgi:hypothetical protein
MEAIFKRWRWGLFAAGLVLGLFLWFHGVKDDPGHAFLHGLIAMMLAFVLVSTDIAELLASPILKFIDSVYLPGGNGAKPPLSYELPIYYERYFRSEEALAAYQAIMKHYPKQINAYAGAIRVCEQQLDDPTLARHYRRVAERLFGREAVLKAVAKSADQWHAERMKSALAPAPSQ